MRYRLIIISLIILIITVHAQPAVEFSRSYGGEGIDQFEDIYAVSNGDYVMCGINNGNYWVVRIDRNGNRRWSQVYDGGHAYSIIETDDGNFFSAGTNVGELGNIVAVLTDGNGEIIWRRYFQAHTCKAVIELKSGEFLLAGYNVTGGQYVGWVAMIDGDGRLLFQRNYQPERHGYFNAMRETDGGVVIAGLDRGGLDHEGWLVKIDAENEGEIIWARHYDEGSSTYFESITSLPGEGFALTGRYNPRRSSTHLVMKVNDDGQRLWVNDYLDEGESGRSIAIQSVGNTGFITVGKQTRRNDGGYRPTAHRTNSVGGLRWFATYELDGVGRNSNSEFNSVVIGEDGNIIAAGKVQLENGNGLDGLVMKLQPEILEPMIFRYSPEDTVFSVFLGDTVQFIVNAEDQAGDELFNLWIMNEDTLSEDTTVTIVFNDPGEHIVQCQVTDNEFTAVVRWHVTAEDFRIDSYSPDSLTWRVQRPHEMNFSLGVNAMEGVEPRYRWILTGHREREDDIGDEADLTYTFDRGGDFLLEGRAYSEFTQHSVYWQIAVNSVLWWWTPHDREFTINLDTDTAFTVIPFNPDSDSMEFQWLLDGEILEDIDEGIEHSFDSAGIHTVTAIVYDGAEVDTVVWTVTVNPNSVNDGVDFLLPTEVTLYPAAPNPFNSTTSIRYFLPRSADVRLTVYDLAGRIVQTLNEGFTIAGKHRATLQGAELTAGVYLLQMEAGDDVHSLKLVLLK